MCVIGFKRNLPSISTMGFWTLILSMVAVGVAVVAAEAKQRTEAPAKLVGRERQLLKKSWLNSFGLQVSGKLWVLRHRNDDEEEEIAAVAADMALCLSRNMGLIASIRVLFKFGVLAFYGGAALSCFAYIFSLLYGNRTIGATECYQLR